MKSIRVILIKFLFIASSIQSFGIIQEESGIEYSVQILLSKKHLNATDKQFKGVKDIREEIINGIYKYTTGRMKNFSEAGELKTKMNELGFKDAFVVRYKDGQRAPLENSAAVKTEPSKTEPPKVVIVEEQTKPALKEEAVNQAPGNEENSMTKSGKEKPVVGSTMTQTEAEFPGGPDSLTHFIMQNLHYPDQRIANEAESRVYVSFTVDYTGKIKNARIAMSLNRECDAEALRLVHMMPDWKPATLNGNPASKEILLPVNFYRPLMK